MLLDMNKNNFFKEKSQVNEKSESQYRIFKVKRLY